MMLRTCALSFLFLTVISGSAKAGSGTICVSADCPTSVASSWHDEFGDTSFGSADHSGPSHTSGSSGVSHSGGHSSASSSGGSANPGGLIIEGGDSLGREALAAIKETITQMASLEASGKLWVKVKTREVEVQVYVEFSVGKAKILEIK